MSRVREMNLAQQLFALFTLSFTLLAAAALFYVDTTSTALSVAVHPYNRCLCAAVGAEAELLFIVNGILLYQSV